MCTRPAWHQSLIIVFLGHEGERWNIHGGAKVDHFYAQAQCYDGNIAIPGCDKNMPGCVIAAARHNRPTIMVYGGTIQAGVRQVDCPAMGKAKGSPVNISDAFESFGPHKSQFIRGSPISTVENRCIHGRNDLGHGKV